jgi:steroid delta-isomerase-like uncharacterized protein
MSPTSHVTSLAHEHASLVRTLYDAYNARDFDQSPAAVADDAEIVSIPLRTTFRGPEGMRQFQRGWATAFPDSRVEVRSVTADEDRVVVEFVGRGTHGGPLVGPAGTIEATGRSVEIPFCDVHDLRDGKIVRARNYFDVVTMMTQLGLMNPASTAGSANVEGASAEPNVTLARRWFEIMNSGQLDAVSAIFAPTYRLHYPDIDTAATGPEVIRGLVSAYRDAFPDLNFTVDQTVGSGDVVLVRWTAEGTNRGSLLGGPATGRFARWTGMSVFRMHGGRIVEDWVENDRLGMLQQLGLAPAPVR